MNKEIKLTNKSFAEELVAHLNESKSNAKVVEKDGLFIVSYELAASAPEGPSVEDKMSSMFNYMCARMDRMHDNVCAHLDRLYTSNDKHQQGHLPPLTPTGLGKLLKASGEEGNYNIQPKTVYASTSTSIEFSTEELKGALSKLQEQDDKPADADVSRLLAAITAQRK